MPNARRLTATLFAVALAGGALSAPAFAQSSVLDVAQLHELRDDTATAMWGGMTVEELEDLKAYNAAEDEIGDVEDILGDSQGNVVAFVIEVGGFLGIGDDDVVVPAERTRLNKDRSTLIVDIPTDEMERLPRWED